MAGNGFIKYLRQGIVVFASCLVLPAAEHHGLIQFGGVPIPGVTVTATQGEKRFTTASDARGSYSFADLADGNWTIKVEMPGFEPVEREVGIVPGAPSPQWQLKLLSFEEMKASAPAPPVEKPDASTPPTSGPMPAGATSPLKSATVAQPSSGSKKPKLPKGIPPPQAANSESGFKRTQANASADLAKAGSDTGNNSNAAPGEMSATNSQPSDGFLINGSVNNGASTPFAQSAAFGNFRRGARSLYNGSLGLVVGNSVWDARSYSITGQDTPRPGYSHLQGVASFGGPIKIPHLVPRNGPNLVVNYQWTRNRNASTSTNRVPTTAERSGDFSQSLNASGHAVNVFDPATGTPFVGNIVPQSLISPQARSLLAFYPLPNFVNGSQFNYQIPLVGSMHSDALQGRVSKALGRRNSINASAAMMSTRSDSTNFLGFLDTTRSLGYQMTANLMHRFSAHAYLTLGYQFSRQTLRTTPFFAERLNVAAVAGVSGTNQEPANWGPPQLSFSSGISGLSDAQYNATRNQTNSISPSLFWSHGPHNVTVGGDLRLMQFNPISQADPRGTFNFTGAAAGSDFGGFLLGIPDTSSIAYGNADKYYRQSVSAAYLNDDWRISSSLTLKVGVRWEYGAPVTELYGRLVNLDVTPGFRAIAPVVAANPTGPLTGRSYPDSLLNPDKKGFEPRLGLTWRPKLASSIVIRAGYGVYRDTSIYPAIASRMAQQSPLSTSLSLNNADHPLTLARGFYLAPNVTTNTFAVDPDFKTGYSQNWQLSVQHNLPGSLILTTTYLGIKGTRAQQQFFPQTSPTDAANPCPSCPVGYLYLTSNGNSTRESGDVQLRRQLHNGFTAQVNYTYSKSIDDTVFPGGQGSSATTTLIAQDWLNLRNERGPSNFDQRHLFNFLVQYTSGMGLGGGTLLEGWRGRLMKDWTFVTNIAVGSGLPLNPLEGIATRGTSSTASIRPDYTGADLYASQPGRFLNPAAVAAPRLGYWGNAGRNSITGPGQFALNASMARTFRFSDRLSFDFRVDTINALNHVTFPSWNVIATSPQFGLPASANPMRNVQATMRLRF